MIRIGTHGSRGSGKTCYYAALFGKRTEGETAILLASEETVSVLEADWKALSCGERPEATAKSLPKTLQYSLTHKGDVFNVEASDYAGALVQRGQQDSLGLKEKVIEWLKACDALLIMVDTARVMDASQEDLREQQTEIGLLLASIQKRGRIATPLALVLTKWDLSTKKLLSVPEETERAAAFVKEHSLLGELAKGVELTGETFQIFPVSAFGGHRDDPSLPPAEGVHPFNVLAPLAWCVERVREIQVKRRKRRVALTAALAGMMAISLAVWLSNSAQSLFDSTKNALVDLTTPPTAARQKIETYRNHWNPFTRKPIRAEALNGLYADYQRGKEAADFQEIRPPRASDDSATQIANTSAYEAFLTNWPGSERRKLVEGYLATAPVLYEEAKRAREIMSRARELLDSLERGQLTDPEKLSRINEFVEQHPEDKVPRAAHPDIDRVRDVARSIDAGMRDARWRELLTFVERHRSQHANCIAEIDKYLSQNPPAEFRQLATDLRRQVEVSWDKSEYDRIRQSWTEMSGAAPTPAQLRTLRGEMTRYVGRDYPPPEMKDSVQVWIDWLAKLERGTNIHILIEAVDVVANQFLDRGKTTLRVEGTVNQAMLRSDTVQKTISETGMTSVRFGKRLGPYAFKLGDSIILAVQPKYGLYYALLPDSVEVRASPVSRRLDLNRKNERVGVLRIRVADQPDLPEYRMP